MYDVYAVAAVYDLHLYDLYYTVLRYCVIRPRSSLGVAKADTGGRSNE